MLIKELAELDLAAHPRRGGARPPEYIVWERMRSRCNNPNDHRYARYGGRGIKVCARWDSFAAFYADMGPRPAGQSIERIDNKRGYEPSNCKWVPKAEQSRNREVCVYIEHSGIRDTAAGWAKRLGLNKQTILNRVAAGLPPDQIVSATRKTWTHRN